MCIFFKIWNSMCLMGILLKTFMNIYSFNMTFIWYCHLYANVITLLGQRLCDNDWNSFSYENITSIKHF